MKKLSLFLILIFCLTLTAFAEGVEWKVENGILTVSGDIGDYTRSEPAPWNANKSEIVSIVVADGVESIGNYAFYGLSKATSITVPDSVKFIGTQFIRETGIVTIDLSGIEVIGNNAFGRADNLTEIILSEKVKSIQGKAFYSETLTVKAPENSYAHKYVELYPTKYSGASITFEKNGEANIPVVQLGVAGDNVFYAVYENASGDWHYEISGLGDMKNFPYVSEKNINKGYTFTPIYYMSLEDTETNIKSVAVIKGVTTVGNYAFHLCTKAKTVTLPDGIERIGWGAFRTCAKLEEIILPETVVEIGKNAFNGCSSLTSVYFPESVVTVEEDIFVKCNTQNITVITDSEAVINSVKQYEDITVVSSETVKTIGIAEVFGADIDSTVTVEGYFVGVANDINDNKTEMLVKDINNDSVIAVRGVPYGAYPNYSYEKGDRISFIATVKLDGSENTPNKRYLEFSSENGDIESTIISKGNEVTYTLENAVTVKSWADMKALFAVGKLNEYTYVKFDGEFYMNYYSSTDMYRIHMNSSAVAVAEIKPDGARSVGFVGNAIKSNIGTNWTKLIYDDPVNSAVSPGMRAVKTVYAIYTGADKFNFQLTILDSDWIREYTYDNADIVKEIAYAYYRQGGQIEYCQSRRSFTATPEMATSQRKMYLDCSSYVNACYYNAFGVYILPEFKNPTTANYNNYARDNQDNPDVIGYWENADYTTKEEQKALLASVKASLEVGDVLVYRHGKTSSTSGHTYIYIGNDTFLHCYGGGSYQTNSSNPALSHDLHASEANGQIATITSYAIFEQESNGRYLFKKTEADTVNSFCLLRPLANGLTPTEEAKSRMKIAGLVMDKTSSVMENSALYTGDTVTYTVTLKNTNKHALENLTLTDTLPTGTEYVSGDLTANGTSLTWKGDVAASTIVTLNWTVRVTATEKETLIVSDSTVVSGVKLGKIVHTLTTFEKAQTFMLTETANTMVSEEYYIFNPLTLANTVYDSMGITVFNTSDVSAVLDKLIDTEAFDRRTDTDLSKMIAPNLFGGTSIRTGYRTIPDNDRTRLISEEELFVGDIILADWSGGNVVYIYMGDSKLLTTENGTCVYRTIGSNIFGADADNILISLLGYNRFAVIRPSLALDKPNVSVEAITITSNPSKTVYNHGETFDRSGMVVEALLSNGNTIVLSNYTVTPEVLEYPCNSVTVSFGDFSATVDVSVKYELKTVSVAEARELEDGAMVRVEGLFAGVADEGSGTGSYEEMLIKDLESDTLIAVRGVPYGAFPKYGYKRGDKISIIVTALTDTTTNTSGKKYLEFSEENGTIEETVISSGNDMGYTLDNVVTITSWTQMKELFKIGTIKEYTYVKFTGTFYLNYYGTTDIFRIHNNASCTSLATMKPDSSRCAGFRNDIMKVNIGDNWATKLYSTFVSGYPGIKVQGKEVTAVFTGADNYNFQLTILEPGWIVKLS